MTRSIAIALSVLAVSATASADPANELELGSWARALRSGSANALTDHDLGGGTFGYARMLPLSPSPKLQLWAVGRFSGGGASGQMFQTMATEIGYLQLTAGVRARYKLRSWLAAGARMQAGAARTDLSIDDAMRTYSDLTWGAVAEGAAQLEVHASRPGFGIGLRFELGYTASSAVPLTPRATDTDEGTLKLPMNESSLGHLDLRGRFFGLTLFGQF